MSFFSEEVQFEHRGLRCLAGKHSPMSGRGEAAALLAAFEGVGVLRGWWCGYVDLPPVHPMHGKHYNDIAVSVHGGLTYSDETDDGLWRVGFDTAHAFDSPEDWDREAVVAEVKRLADQLIDGLRVKQFVESLQ